MQSVCACIVTYHPREELRYLVKSLLVDFDYVCIVDNASEVDVQAILGDTFEKVSVVELGENQGVASGLNIAIENADALGCGWVVCFDQDTSYLCGSKSSYFSALLGAKNRVVGSGYESSGYVRFFSFLNSGGKESYVRARTVITSGSFFSVDLWRLVGGFDNDLFVDSVDHDFCLKVWSVGGDVVKLKRNTVFHRVGLGQSPIGVPIHSPLRKYYIFRNVVLLIKRHGFRFPSMVSKANYEIIFGVCFITFLRR